MHQLISMSYLAHSPFIELFDSEDVTHIRTHIRGRSEEVSDEDTEVTNPAATT